MGSVVGGSELGGADGVAGAEVGGAAEAAAWKVATTMVATSEADTSDDGPALQPTKMADSVRSKILRQSPRAGCRARSAIKCSHLSNNRSGLPTLANVAPVRGLDRKGVIASIFPAERRLGRLLEFQVELFILVPLLETVDADVAEEVLLVRRNPVALDKFEQGEESNDDLQPGRARRRSGPEMKPLLPVLVIWQSIRSSRE